MKQLTYCLAFFALLFTACEGDPGPQGPPGFDGLDGQVADAIELRNVNFTAPNYELFLEFEQIYSDEVILVYRRWNPNDDGPAIWRLLPQTIIFDDGSDLVYNFDFTQNDLFVFLESVADLDTLGSEFTNNQTFRVVIVPAENISGMDISNLDLISETLQINEFEVR